MGYKASVSTITVRFAEGHRYHGAEARVRGMTYGEWEAATGLDGGDGDNTATSTRFGEHLVSWNLEHEDGTPLPATSEGMRQADQALILAMADAWLQALVGVHNADPLPDSSPSGGPSPVESIPMEALSESLAS